MGFTQHKSFHCAGLPLWRCRHCVVSLRRDKENPVLQFHRGNVCVTFADNISMVEMLRLCGGICAVESQGKGGYTVDVAKLRAEGLVGVEALVDVFASEFGRRVHLETVRRWCRTGRLESVRVGGRLLSTRAAVDRFVARCSGLPAGERETVQK
jgi:excisionase family DNA binding protein